MRRLIAAALPLVIWGCGSNTASVSSSVPPLVTPTNPTAAQSSLGGQALLTSAQTGAVSNGRLTDPVGKQNYFPMSEGNTWIYDAEIVATTDGAAPRRANAELMFKLSNVKHEGDKTISTLTVSQGDQVVDKSIWQESPAGIVQIASGVDLVPFDKPEPVLQLPVKNQQVMTWSNSGAMPDTKRGSQHGRTVVSTSAQIDTAISTVQGVESATTQTFTSTDGGGDASTSTWFEPGVGIVRLVQTLKQRDTTLKSTLRLKSWTLQH